MSSPSPSNHALNNAPVVTRRQPAGAAPPDVARIGAIARVPVEAQIPAQLVTAAPAVAVPDPPATVMPNAAEYDAGPAVVRIPSPSRS